MVDTLGIQSFPASAPATGQPAGDVALGYLLEFLKASVNAACDGMWSAQGVCPGRHTIDFTFHHDPRKLFEEGRLPALYAWRGKRRSEKAADNLWKQVSTIELAWVAEGAEEDHMVARDSAMWAIAGAIDVSLRRDRTPTWIVTGDTDVISVYRGSSLTHHCNWSQCEPAESSPEEFKFERIDGSSAPLPYYGFTTSLTVDEYVELGVNAYPIALNAAAETNEAPPVIIHLDKNDPVWTPT